VSKLSLVSTHKEPKGSRQGRRWQFSAYGLSGRGAVHPPNGLPNLSITSGHALKPVYSGQCRVGMQEWTLPSPEDVQVQRFLSCGKYEHPEERSEKYTTL